MLGFKIKERCFETTEFFTIKTVDGRSEQEARD